MTRSKSDFTCDCFCFLEIIEVQFSCFCFLEIIELHFSCFMFSYIVDILFSIYFLQKERKKREKKSSHSNSVLHDLYMFFQFSVLVITRFVSYFIHSSVLNFKKK